MTDRTEVEVPGSGADVAERVHRVLAERAFRVVYQPIVDLTDGKAVAVEALSRFTAEPYGPPDTWFADAWQVGMGAELELAAFEAAVDNVDRIPETCRVAVNLSPLVITHPGLVRHVEKWGAERVVIELTEHVAVDDYDRVRTAVAVLRARGARLAVDDMGAGFASFRHIVKLAPDIIKLDRELVQDIDSDPVRRSVVTAMVRFAEDVGSDIVAEGIETRGELEAVRALDIRYGQGMLIGEPEPVESLARALRLGTRTWLPRTAPSRDCPTGGAHVPEHPSGADGHVARVSGALAGLAEAVRRGELDAEPAELAALNDASAAVGRIAARRAALEPLTAPGAPWS